MDKPHSYTILGIIQEYAPDGPAQELIAHTYRRLQSAGLSETQVLTSMLGILLDGLRHENWPWTNYTLAATQS